MIKTFKILIASLVFFGSAAFAQCVQSPIIMGQGYQGGSPCWGGAPQQQFVQQQFVPQQQFFQPQQVVQQQQRNIPQGCYIVKKAFWDRAKDAAGEGLLTGLVGGLIGAAVDRDRGTGGRYTEVGASAAAAYGFASTLSNDSTMVCPSQQTQVVVQGQQQVVQTQQAVQQQQSAPACSPPANPVGSRPGILNLPASPQHGQTVCAMPGDSNISRWL